MSRGVSHDGPARIHQVVAAAAAAVTENGRCCGVVGRRVWGLSPVRGEGVKGVRGLSAGGGQGRR